MEYSREQLIKAMKKADKDNNVQVVNELASRVAEMDRANNPVQSDVMTSSPTGKALGEQKAAENMSTFEFVQGTARQGMTGTLSAISAGSNLVADVFRDKPLMEGSAMERFGDYYKLSQDMFNEGMEMAGATERKFTPEQLLAADPSNGYYTAGIEAVSDPMGYSLKGGKLAYDFFGNLVAGLGSKTGADIGEGIGGDTGKLVGALVGGTVAPTVSRSAIETAVDSTSSQVAKAVKKTLDPKGTYKAAEASVQSKAASNLLNKIADEQGVKSIDSIVKDFDEISSVVGENNFPLLVSLSDNKMLRAELASVVSRKPEIRHQLDAELTRLSQVIDDKADTLFGGRAMSLTREPGVSPEVVKASEAAAKNVEAIDSKIAQLTDPLTTAKRQDTGKAIQNLVKAKEANVRKEVGPKYDKLMAEADKAGVQLRGDSTRAIYNFVEQNRMSDIFGKGTELDMLIKRHFSPRMVNGNKAYPNVAFSNVDSLKRKINELQRKKLTPTEERQLAELENVVNMERVKMPGEWNQRLIELDKEFYTKVGIPFGEQGIVDINAKKYSEQVAPIITSKPSAMKQFLDLGGEESVQIANNAVMSKMYDVVIDPVTSRVNEKLLKKYIKDNNELIDMVPGLREKVDDIAVGSERLQMERGLIEQRAIAAENKLAEANLLSLDPNAISFTTMSRNVLSTEGYNKFIARANLLEPKAKEAIVNRMKREVIANARSSGDAVSYLTNPEQITNVRKMFGDQYIKDIQAFAKLSDALKKADVSTINYNTQGQRVGDVLPGVDAPYLGSQFRDRISSITQKVSRILSKVRDSKALDAQDAQLVEIMFDPEGLRKLATVARRSLDEKGTLKVDAGKVLTQMRSTAADVAPRYFAISMKEVARDASEKEREVYEPGATFMDEPLRVDVTRGQQ